MVNSHMCIYIYNYKSTMVTMATQLNIYLSCNTAVTHPLLGYFPVLVLFLLVGRDILPV